MKNISIFMVMAVIFGFAHCFSCANSVWAQNGVIRELTGDVELKHSGSAVFVRASAGDTVSQNTIISTGFRSTAVIAIGSSLINVRQLTRLSLAEIQRAENAENINVNLQTGRVRVEVTPPAGTRTEFSVQSPSSTASVRGTVFETDGFNYSTVRGVIDVRGNSEPATMLSAGMSTFINTEGTPADPFAISAAASVIAPVEGAQRIQNTAAASSAAAISIVPDFN